MTSTPPTTPAAATPAVLQLAAFAASPGGGNPAGVVLDASALVDDAMLRLAAELGHPETAFVVDPAVGGDPRHVAVRYFSPGAEIPFCGHATIATAVSLAERDGAGPFVVETAAGTIVVETVLDAAGRVEAMFTSVEPAVRELDAGAAARLLGLLGLTVDDLDPAWPLQEAFAGNWHPMVAVRERATFDGFRFEPAAMRTLMDECGWAGTVAVVHASGERLAGVDLVVEARNLFPVGSVTEDPATGSAAAAIGAWLRAAGVVSAPARLVVRQGSHVGRPSVIGVSVPVAGGVTVSGTAVPLLP